MKYDDKKIDEVYSLSKNIRRKCLEMALSAGSAGSHVGGSFSCIEIFAALYGAVMRYDAKNPTRRESDHFIASKTHCILSNYSTLALCGFFPVEELNSFHENDGLLAGKPFNPDIGLEFTGGALAMGLSVGIGMAIAAKRDGIDNKTYVLLGDGESNEGAVWEGFLTGAQLKLDNLVAVIDYNNMQFDGVADEILSLKPLDEKLKAFGWETVTVNGHSIEQLLEAFSVPHEGKPLVIIAETVKANGIERLQNTAASHFTSIKREDYDLAIKELEAGKYDRV